MQTLFENPLPIAAIGGLAAAFALIVFLSRRTLSSLIALVAVVAVVCLLLAIEFFVVTDREQVETSVDELLAAVESNDATAVVAWIDPTATRIRADVEALMPLLKIEKARAMGTITVEVAAHSPPSAVSQFQGFLQGVHSRSGTPVVYANQRVDIEWVKSGDRWHVTGYTAYYNDQPIDAVSTARGSRPTPTR